MKKNIMKFFSSPRGVYTLYGLFGIGAYTALIQKMLKESKEEDAHKFEYQPRVLNGLAYLERVRKNETDQKECFEKNSVKRHD